MSSLIGKTHSKLWWLLLIPVVLVIGLAIAMQPLVDWETRRVLAVFEGYTSTYGRARLHPFSFKYEVTDVKIVKDSAGGDKEPFLYLKKYEMGVLWRELLHRHVVARVDIDQAKIHLIAAKAKAQQQTDPEIPDLGPKLKAVLPLEVDRVQVRNSEIVFIDKTQKEFPRIWLHEIESTLENLVTRAALSKGTPTILALSAKFQKDTLVTMYASADPLAKGLYFMGRARAEHLELTELSEMMSSETGLRFDRGTLDLFAEFACKDGMLSGGLKPVLKDAHIVQGKPSLGNALKAAVAEVGLKIFSDDVPGRHALATVIPIQGRVDKLEIQVWPTILGVVRNAFVQGVSESFATLPPPEAGKKQDPITQLVEGLDKKNSAPKAQPTEGVR